MTDTLAPTTYTLTFPGRPALLANAVKRMHWAREAEARKLLRREAFLLARAARIPHFAAIGVTVRVELKGKRSIDVDSIAPTLKPLLDGISDAHVVDDDRFVRRLTLLAPVLGADRDALVVEIEGIG